uniref:HECT-type E3 ubiquitin transferase n=1 Tax=Peronospora matthiolae TaxID=2874970 RepID=A0AAV1T9I8_9STRA
MSARSDASDSADDDDAYASLDHLDAHHALAHLHSADAHALLSALDHEDDDNVSPSLRALLAQLETPTPSATSTSDSALSLAHLISSASATGIATNQTRPCLFQHVRAQLHADAPVTTQLEGLSTLCETLSLSTEDALAVAGFRVDAFVPLIVTLLRHSLSTDVLLLAARALSMTLELFPSAAIPLAASEHVIGALCAKLVEIQYIDVAELALQMLEVMVCKAETALHSANSSTSRFLMVPVLSSTAPAPAAAPAHVAKLCAQYRLQVIEENGFVAVLQFIDFFPLEIQRRAARIVSQLATDFPLAMETQLRHGLPFLTNLLRSLDNDVVQSTVACLQKLGESKAFTQSHEFAQMIATEEICALLLDKLAVFAGVDGGDEAAAAVAVPLSLPLAPVGYTSILRFFACLLSCVPSDLGATTDVLGTSHLRFVKLPHIVTALLAKQEVLSENQLLRETLKLVLVVVPFVNDVFSADAAIPPATLTLARGILPLITRVYDATSRPDLRYDCLGVISRCCSLVYADWQPFKVEERTELARLAAFLARVLRPNRTGTTAHSKHKADSDFVLIELALKLVEMPLQHTGAREATKEDYERYGVTNIIRYYASTIVEPEEDKDKSDLQSIRPIAVRLVRDYLGDKSSVVSVMVRFERLVDDLQTALISSSTTGNDQTASLLDVLLQLREFVVEGNDTLTAHEIACSGLVKVLIRILSFDKSQQAFSQMLTMQGAGSGGLEFVTLLSRCLQDAISSEKDVFVVSAADSSSASLSSGSIVTDLDQLTQHIKVHVLIEEEKRAFEPDIKDRDIDQAAPYDRHDMAEHGAKRNSLMRNRKNRCSLNKRAVHDTVVLVEPLARIETMEVFIADKLFGRDRNTDVISDELSEEDDESGGTEVEEREEFLRDDIELRRVVAVYKGQVLPADMSILEAIVKFGDLDATGHVKSDLDAPGSTSKSLPTSGSPLWTASPHAITFRVAAAPISVDDVATMEPASADSKIVVASSFLSKPAGMDEAEQWWDDVWDLLLLLKLLREQCSRMPFGTQLHFVNSYLSLQVRRALQQPVCIVANHLPKWCFRLVYEFPFVLKFETRCHFMYATTCGCSRAIQYLCRSVWRKAVMEEPAQVRPSTSAGRRRYRDGTSRTRTSALDNVMQMVKLPRLKVRVARSRLLQSAIKLLTLYGGKKAVIEIEFLGEVGTGLGPTTEFFTLVCQQIQSKQLQLWWDDDRIVSGVSHSADVEQKSKHVGADTDHSKTNQANGSLAIRGYHRVAVYHCPRCKALCIPACPVHQQLLTRENRGVDSEGGAPGQTSEKGSPCSAPERRQPSRHSIPQCAQCSDNQNWHSAATSCDCSPNHDGEENDSTTEPASGSMLKWWILSDEEAQYLAKVFPTDTKRVQHPVLQCAHCDTVNFPGTDAGIVVMNGNRMVSRSGRRMFERDYRAVTKHVSPLCEGTPLNVMISAITRHDVEMLVENLARSPDVLESEVESLNYLSEAALLNGTVGGGPPVVAPFGLYPKPYLCDNELDAHRTSVDSIPEPSGSDSLDEDASSFSGDEVDVLAWFRFLGRFVSQAILDERLLNLPFARPFVRLLRGEVLVGNGVSVETSLSFVEELDPVLAKSLRYLHDLAVQYAVKEASGDIESDDVAAWTAEVDALCRSFTMIGADEIPLQPDGKDIAVTLSTLRQYVTLNLEFLLDRTIKSQVQAFKQGFEQICGGKGDRQLFRFLQAFDVHELEALLSDRSSGSSIWDRDGVDLREHMVCDHGYTADSRAIANLVSILCELSLDEQRLFVRFVTGANRLPLGGLRNLEPKLTVVRKLVQTTDGSRAKENDAVLPSASTCTNYLKLPDYSTREVMKRRLLYCINEGQCSFHLS